MIIPGEACATLTAETARRLRGDDIFTTFTDADTVAQSELRGCLGRLEGKKPHEVHEAILSNTSLARASIFFARCTSGDLHAVPWVRSLQMRPFAYHHKIGMEFNEFAEKISKDVELDTPFGNIPDIVAGLIVPRDDDSVVFFAHDNTDIPAEHITAVRHSQQVLAGHGVELHAHVGGVFLRAGEDPSSPS